MKKNITEHEFIDTFKNWESRKDQFSYGALKAIYNEIVELEDCTGLEQGLDVVAICCEYTEYGSALEAYRDHYGDDSDLPDNQKRTTEEEAREWLENNTTVLDAQNYTDGLKPVKSIVIVDF